MSMPGSADIEMHWCLANPTRIPGSVLSVLYVKEMSASWGLQMGGQSLVSIANFWSIQKREFIYNVEAASPPLAACKLFCALRHAHSYK